MAPVGKYTIHGSYAIYGTEKSVHKLDKMAPLPVVSREMTLLDGKLRL